MFPSFEVFCQVMDQCTENYECLVVNNNAKSNKIEDQVFWYKAEAHNNFTMGAPEFWQHHSENFNDDYDDLDDNAHINIKKRVHVKKLM
jgi:hypothetical protein